MKLKPNLKKYSYKKNINNIKNNKVTLLIFNIQFFSKILS